MLLLSKFPKPCPYHVVEALAKAFSCYGMNLLKTIKEENIELLCAFTPKYYVEVFAAKNRVHELLAQRYEVLLETLFSAGIHIARLTREGHRVILLLGALELLRGRFSRGYVVIKGKGVKAFLYGRDVLQESIECMEPFDSSECLGNPVLVCDEKKEPLGWGRVAKKGGRLTILNVLDLGWYLRCGV